jgi:hypothetical protein
MSTYAFVSIFFGGNSLGPYGDVFSDIQVRFFGLVVLILCIGNIYKIFVEWPEYVGKKEKIKEILKTFFNSWFSIIWFLLFFVSLAYSILQIFLLKIVYYILIIMCLYFQNKFVKKIKSILD